MLPRTVTCRLACLTAVLTIAFFSSPRPAICADKAAVKKAVAKGANYLRSIQAKLEGGHLSLCTYALLKADGKPTDAGNARAIAEIVKRCSGNTYEPLPSDKIYGAGIEAMILADVGPEKYQPELKKIASYLVGEQRDDGAYSYRGPDSAGDTSVTQYAALGLWACYRTGVEIPRQVWDRLAMWHLKSQTTDGGFPYNPGESAGITRADPNLTMTAAGASTMSIAGMFLHPEKSQFQTNSREKKKSALPAGKDPLGVLTVRNPKPNSATQLSGPYKPQASYADIQGAIRQAVGWSGKNFTPEYNKIVRMYNYYTIERMGALTETEKLGGHDWFDECASRLLAEQTSEGSWTISTYDRADAYVVGTSFGVLFLTRSTAKLLNRIPPEDPIGGGMQAGGRGLPDDLSSVKMQDGRVAQEESLGPLDDLLKSLESAGSDDLFNLQTQIVKKIQLGDRSELIGQADRLIKLVEYPSPEIRRTALWALARSDDLKLARYAVAAIEDPDADVLVEAHNALCWMSRRPNAFGIPDSPFTGLPPNSTDEQKAAAVEKWRQLARQKWGQWYLRMCPYKDRNDPFALDLERKIGLR